MISICMMVKNEENNLRRCLDSIKILLDKGIAELIVVDTGSEDKTVKIAREYTEKLYYHEWNYNFSEMRNISISYAKGNWIFILDADEEVENTLDLISAFESKNIEYYNTINLSVKNLDSLSNQHKYNVLSSPRLFRNDGSFRYEGAVHNQPIYKEPCFNIDVNIVHYGYVSNDKELMKKKFERTSDLLLRELKKDPNNIYYIYQLGVSYDMYNKKKEALDYFEKAYLKLKSKSSQERKNYLALFQSYASSLYSDKQYDKCINVCNEGLKLEKDFIDFYYLIANSYSNIGNKEKSFEAFKKYIEIYRRYKNLPIYRDPSVITYHIDDIAKSIASYNVSTYYYGLEEYNKSYIYYKDIVTIDLKIALSAKLLIKMKKYDEIVEYINNLDKKEDIYKYLNVLEGNINSQENINDVYSKLSLIKGTYGDYCLIKCKDFIDEGEVVQFFHKNDCNFLDIYYFDLLLHIKKSSSIVNIIRELAQGKQMQVVNSLINKDEEFFYKIIKLCEEVNIEKLTLSEITVFKNMTRIIIINLLNKDEKIVFKKSLFNKYLDIGIIYMKSIYNFENIYRIINVLSSEEKFLYYLYRAKLYSKLDKKECIDNIKKALEVEKAFAKCINVYKENLIKEAVDVFKNKEIDEYLSVVKNNVLNLVNLGELDSALNIIGELKAIVKCDESIFNMEAMIYIMKEEYFLAESSIRKGIELYPKSFDLYYNLAYMYEKIGFYNKAVDIYKIAREICASDDNRIELDNIILMLEINSLQN
ncbi:glycosyltransferase family 2 protein [Clostridium cylindrosporum]|uniref:Glycosyl transferase, family 2 n=1 Tax=Clostridium cylindrosporum DSM 605 TaxID=1121307 RepID=A0A0J8DEI0_CLOCY|nr:glycosyltransferase family 2 protein [Clostridium cylindrosporum]KMT22639.1 glycosyl transferase, family 2 [Clostridium cylindrosporum DSM 605]